jgi:hypothetical protein
MRRRGLYLSASRWRRVNTIINIKVPEKARNFSTG